MTSSARPWNSGRPAASALRAQCQPPEAIAGTDTRERRQPERRPPANHMPCRRTALFRSDQSKTPKLRLSKEMTNRPQVLRHAAHAEHGSPVLLYLPFSCSQRTNGQAHMSLAGIPRGVPPPEPSWPIVGRCLPLIRLAHKASWEWEGRGAFAKLLGFDLGVTSPLPVKLLKQVQGHWSNLSCLRPDLM